MKALHLITRSKGMISGQSLVIFDAVPGGMTGEVRDRMYTIPLEEIKDFKASNFALNRYMKFTGNGEKIHLSAFANNIGLIEAVGSVAGK